MGKTIQIMIDKRGVVTNGDVIKAIFPSAKIFIDERGDYHYVYVNAPNMGPSWKIREYWWNSPYKAESEE